jgi:hypothetical protein
MTTTKANLIENVIVGEYGYPVFLHLVDELNASIDISAYDTFQVLLRTPDDLKLVTYSATLFSDGTDGKLYFTPAATDIDRSGTWHGMVKLTDTGTAVAKSQPFDMKVTNTL